MNDFLPAQKDKKLPERLTLPCEFDKETGLIEFWSGKTTLSKDGRTRTGSGNIFFEIAPKPNVLFEFESDEQPEAVEVLESKFNTEQFGIHQLSCDQPIGPMTVNVTNTNKLNYFSGHLGEHIEPDPHFDSIKYLTINGPDLFGKIIEGSDSVFKGRTETKVDGFEIVIDQIKEKKKNIQFPFVFTHIIEVRFKKSSTNSGIDVIGSVLQKTLSFMCGRWVGLVGPWGYSDTGKLNRAFPRVTMVSMNPPGLSWYDRMVMGTFEELFSCLFHAYNEPEKYKVITTGIGWYIESEMSAGFIEGSIILQQAALESFAWLDLVDRTQRYSKSKFKKLHAAEKIRQLLKVYSIPSEIPAKCEEILSYANDNNLKEIDLPEVLVHIRNSLVHGTPSKVMKLFSRRNGSHERVGLWYQINGLLAQAILAIVGYQGKITCRSLDVEFSHSAIKDVPWRK